MINLAAYEIHHTLGRYVLTGLGLGLLIGVTLTMAGVYRGMVDDGRVLLQDSGADIWVVQQDTLGPFAEPSTLHDDTYRSLLGIEGVADAANVTYSTMQVQHRGEDVRVMVSGYRPGGLGGPSHLIAGRPLVRDHYEAVADVRTGFELGDRVRIRRHEYTVVGLTRRMVASGGDPMLFIPLQDAQQVQFLRDNESIHNQRARLAANPRLNLPGIPGLLAAVQDNQFSNHSVNAVLVQVRAGFDPARVAADIRRWKHLQAFTLTQQEDILVGKVIATAARQIFMFLVILSVVSGAIVALIIYNMTIGKMKEIAVLKLIGTPNRTIAGMILQESLGLGLIGFIVGKVAASLWGPHMPKYILLLVGDARLALVFVLILCALASIMGIRAALSVDPATAIGG